MIINYDEDRRRPVAGGRLYAWGEILYPHPLAKRRIEDYELKPAPQITEESHRNGLPGHTYEQERRTRKGDTETDE